MKTIETTFEPSDDEKSAIGRIELCGTDKEIQSMLNSIGSVIEQHTADEFVVGEYVRVKYDNVYEFKAILGVKTGSVSVADKDGETIDVPMSSVQNMGERRVLSLVGGRVPKDIEVGDLVILTDDMLYECITVGYAMQKVVLTAKGNRHVIDIHKFASDDKIILPNGVGANVVGYTADGKVSVDNGSVYHETELAPWDEVVAVQRYAASFGMKLNVDVV